MRIHFTDIALRQFPNPAGGQVKLRDESLPGFGCIVGKRTKTFFVMYGKERTTKTIGRYPQISLKDARAEAKRLLLQQPDKKRSLSLSEAREAFLEDCRTRIRESTTTRYDYSLRKLKSWGDRVTDATDIKSAKAFYNWCVREGVRDSNPYLYSKIRFNQRDRVLTDEEIKQIWAYDYPPYSDYLKVLLLTGQRRGQWADFTIEDDLLVFPERVMKTSVEHRLPLLPMAREYVERLKPFNGWSKAKARVDRHVPIPKWVVHDLRRTHSTSQARIGTPIHVTEAILCHSSGTISGVARVYNRHTYIEEAREALAKYEDWLHSLVS